jgi:hypothetical protein
MAKVTSRTPGIDLFFSLRRSIEDITLGNDFTKLWWELYHQLKELNPVLATEIKEDAEEYKQAYDIETTLIICERIIERKVRSVLDELKGWSGNHPKTFPSTYLFPTFPNQLSPFEKGKFPFRAKCGG